LYISDGSLLGHIQLLSPNESSSEPIIVASDLMTPNKFYVDKDMNGSTVYDTCPYLNNVEKWISGATRSIQICDGFNFCKDVSVDIDKNVFVSIFIN
jgi:hypothetical protein